MDRLGAAVKTKLYKILTCLMIILSAKVKQFFFLMISYVSTYPFYFVLEF